MITGKTELSRIAVIGDYVPRQCGIATFTADLCESLAGQFGDSICFAMPVNDADASYAYPPRVRFEFSENDLNSYKRAADFLNLNNVNLVCLQHEYGLFGGTAGSYILSLLRELRMPVVTTLHTILREPSLEQRTVLMEVAQLSDRLIAMSRRGVEFLQEIYGVPEEKIDIIPHGIHDVPFVDPNFHKDKFGVEGKLVILTFGLLSRNKGIEYAIEALPTVLASHPNVVYLVVGATHPHVKKNEGESYRTMLQELAQAKGVAQNVIFHDRFVSKEELLEYIGAADIYVTPYLNAEQITSGSLSYAVGAGKAVVSTPYWHAEELLAEGRGILVPFKDPAALASGVLHLLNNETERHAMRKRAYLFGREMIWPEVAKRYMESFQRDRGHIPRPAFAGKITKELPPIKLDHLRRMTDDTGILQHAVFTVPNYNEGYTTDDNARALALAILFEELGGSMAAETKVLAFRYLSFLWHAFNPAAQRFRNFFSYERKWLEDVGSEDSHGRTLWALGMVLGRSKHREFRGVAVQLFNKALSPTPKFTSPRAWAFTLIGIHEYLRRFAGDRAAQDIRDILAGKLMDLYRANQAEDWPWFENSLSYSNATLPHALLLCGQWIPHNDMRDVGLKTLDWLVNIQRSETGHFIPIGSNGFYTRGGEKARFDQQPIEAHTMVSACLEAYRMTGDQRWRDQAQWAFDWFLGQNDLRFSIYDPLTGGCRDGLHPDRANQNRGAEATLAFLMSLLEVRLNNKNSTPSPKEK